MSDFIWCGEAAKKAQHYHDCRPLMRWEAPDPLKRESIEVEVKMEDAETAKRFLHN